MMPSRSYPDNRSANEIADRIFRDENAKGNSLVEDPAIRFLVQALSAQISELEGERSRLYSEAFESLVRRVVPRWQGRVPASTVFWCASQDHPVELKQTEHFIKPSRGYPNAEFRVLADKVIRPGGVHRIFRFSEDHKPEIMLNCGSDLGRPSILEADDWFHIDGNGARHLLIELVGALDMGDQLLFVGQREAVQLVFEGKWRLISNGRISPAFTPLHSNFPAVRHPGIMQGSFGLSPLRHQEIVAARYLRHVAPLGSAIRSIKKQVFSKSSVPHQLAAFLGNETQTHWVWVELPKSQDSPSERTCFGVFRNWFVAADLRLRNFPKRRDVIHAILPEKTECIPLRQDPNFSTESFLDLIRLRSWDTDRGRARETSWQPNWLTKDPEKTPTFKVFWAEDGVELYLDKRHFRYEQLTGMQVSYLSTGGEEGNGIRVGSMTEFYQGSRDSNLELFNLFETEGGLPPLRDEFSQSVLELWVRNGLRAVSPWDIEQIVTIYYDGLLDDIHARYGPVQQGRQYLPGLLVEAKIRSDGADRLSANMLQSECEAVLSRLLVSPMPVQCIFIEDSS